MWTFLLFFLLANRTVGPEAPGSRKFWRVREREKNKVHSVGAIKFPQIIASRAKLRRWLC
jgi:hypothetical protein